MKKFAKLLVLLLTVALICGAIAMVASAEEAAAPGTNLKDAIDGATDGKVTLTENAYLSETVTINQNLTIDLAGYTLTVNTAVAFDVTANVEFNIVGNGALIDLGGCLITSGADVKPTVVVSNARINHNGKNVANDNYTVINVHNGTHTFDNVNIDSTAPVTKTCYSNVGLQYEGFINMARPVTSNNVDSSNKEGATINFVKSYFHSDMSFDMNHNQAGFSVFNVVGNGRLNVTDSYVRNKGCLIKLGYARPLTNGAKDGSVQNITVVNSTLISDSYANGNQRNEAFWGHMLDGLDKDTYGTFYFKDSFISAEAYRFAHAGKNNGSNGTSRYVYDACTIRQGGHNGKEDGLQISRGIPVYFKNGCTLIGSKASAFSGGSGATVYADKGTRANLSSIVTNLKSIVYNVAEGSTVAGTVGANLTAADMVYDPAGNKDCPYVYGGTASSIAPAGADKFEYGSFNYMVRNDGSTANNYPYGIWQDGKGGPAQKDAPAWQEGGFFHSAVKRGAAYDVVYGTNSSFKYWVNPDTADANSKIGSKRIFSGSESDPFFNVGDSEGSTLSTRFAQYGVYDVVVYSFDIGTDSEYGYPKSDLGIGAREATGTGSNNKNGSTWATLHPDGTLENKSLESFPEDGVKLSTTAFNTLTLVAFIGETGAQGTGYFYLNGEYIGYTATLTAAGANFLQGVRIMPRTNTNHIVGQSFLLDNVTRIRYAKDAQNPITASKENADKYAPAYVKNTNPTRDVFVTGGMAYGTLEEAIDASYANVEGEDKQVLPVNVIAASDVPALINKNITIYTYGNTLNFAEGSHACVMVGDKAAPGAYTFDAAYNEYVVYYYWLRPGYTPQDDVFGEGTWEEEPEKYFYIQELKAGMTPAPEEGMIHYGSYDPETGVVKVHNGKWALPGEEETGSVFEPLTLEYAMEMYEYGAPVMIAPYYDEVTALYYVSDADGHIIRAGETDAEFSNEFATVIFGEIKTIDLLNNATLTKSSTLIGGEKTTVTNLNLNGYKLEYRIHGTVAWVGRNMTLNVYSSVPGASIYSAGIDASGAMKSQRMFAIAPKANTDGNEWISQTTNAHINIGTVEGIEESKNGDVSLYNGIVVEGVTGDDTCSIVVDNVYAERYRSESSGMVMTRYYNGDIIIKNSTFVNYAGTMIDMKGCGNDESVNKDTDYSKYPYNNPAIVLTPYVLFDNCTLVNLATDAKLIGNNGDGYDGEFTDGSGNPIDVAHQLEFRDCVISALQLNGSNQDERTVFTGTNIISKLGFGDHRNFIKGQERYEYYAPVTLASLGLEDKGGYAVVTLATVENGAIVEYQNAIVEYGVTMTEEQLEELGLRGVYTLPQYFMHATVTSSDAVFVNWKDEAGNDVAKKYYYAGPTETIGNGIPASEFAGANATITGPAAAADITEGLVATKKVFAGWDKEFTNVKANTFVNAVYEVVANVNDVKANISLYSDFDVNLYIPEIYKDLVVVKYNDVELEELTTNREGYFKVTVDQLASEAASDVQFVVTVTEANKPFTLNYSVNVANYAKYILEATEGYTEADKTLMKYVVAYANEAYKYAKGGAAVNETLNTLATTYEATPTNPTYVAVQNPAEISKVVTLCNVVLESAPKFVFTIDQEFVGTVVIGGTEYTYTEASAEDRVVTVEGTRAYNFLDDITIKVGEAEGKYNYASYAAYHVKNAAEGTEESGKEASANALELIKALYEYVNCAKTYNANK